jgi:hypothetical protein
LFRNLFEVEGAAAAGVGSVDKQPWLNPPQEPQTGTVDYQLPARIEVQGFNARNFL